MACVIASRDDFGILKAKLKTFYTNLTLAFMARFLEEFTVIYNLG